VEQVLDLGFGVPTRVVLREDRDFGHWECELQVRVDEAVGWERVMTFAPKRAGMTAELAFARAVEVSKKNGPKFFGPWETRRSTALAATRAAEAEKARKAADYARAAPLREAYTQDALRELGRRSDEKAREAEAAARARPDDPLLEGEGLR
jgi:hypothetical protein